MLSKAKHLAFSAGYEVEILRLRLRMTLRHSLSTVRRFNCGVRVERGSEEAMLAPIATILLAMVLATASVEGASGTKSDLSKSEQIFAELMALPAKERM